MPEKIVIQKLKLERDDKRRYKIFVDYDDHFPNRKCGVRHDHTLSNGSPSTNGYLKSEFTFIEDPNLPNCTRYGQEANMVKVVDFTNYETIALNNKVVDKVLSLEVEVTGVDKAPDKGKIKIKPSKYPPPQFTSEFVSRNLKDSIKKLCLEKVENGDFLITAELLDHSIDRIEFFHHAKGGTVLGIVSGVHNPNASAFVNFMYYPDGLPIFVLTESDIKTGDSGQREICKEIKDAIVHIA